jgi:hypothetical protein
MALTHALGEPLVSGSRGLVTGAGAFTGPDTSQRGLHDMSQGFP